MHVSGSNSRFACSELGCYMCSAHVYAMECCGQGLTKVVLVKPWFRVALGLPLQFYNGINTPSGAVFFGCMHGLVSATAP